MGALRWDHLKKQFMESQDFQAAVTEAVVDNQNAHNTMADCFFSDGPGIAAVIMALPMLCMRPRSISHPPAAGRCR